MTVLFATTILPMERRTGSEVASAAFVEALRETGSRVIVLGYRRAGSGRPAGADEVRVADRHIETAEAGWRPIPWLARAAFTRRAYSAAKYEGRRYRATLAAMLRRHRPQLAVIDHAQLHWLAGILERAAVPFVFIAHNVERDIYGAAAAATRPPRRWVAAREARRIGSAEADLTRRAAAVWTLTAGDASGLQDAAATASVRNFDLPPAVAPAEPLAPEVDVGILGTWSWEPNAAGLRWFADRVRPLLDTSVSTAVGGAGAGALLAGVSGVEYRGRVPDAAAFLRSARVVAVPSVAGSGVQVKTLDAIAAGRPVVATSVAMRGVGKPPAFVSVRDDPREFAAAISDGLHAQGGAREAAAAAGDWVAGRRRSFAAAVRDAVAAAEPRAAA